MGTYQSLSEIVGHHDRRFMGLKGSKDLVIVDSPRLPLRLVRQETRRGVEIGITNLLGLRTIGLTRESKRSLLFPFYRLQRGIMGVQLKAN